ncbi:MAG: hypothetical protein ACOX3K_00400 [Bacilli bacterium]|jgi:hypothetical protein
MKFPKKYFFVLPVFLMLTGCEGVLKDTKKTDVFTPPEPVKVERMLNTKEKVDLMDNVMTGLASLTKCKQIMQGVEREGEMSLTERFELDISLYTGNDYKVDIIEREIYKAPIGEAVKESKMGFTVFSDHERIYAIEYFQDNIAYDTQPLPEEPFPPLYENLFPGILNPEEAVFLGEDGNYYVIIIESYRDYYNWDGEYHHELEEQFIYLKINKNFQVDRFYTLAETYRLTTGSTATPEKSEMQLAGDMSQNASYTYGKVGEMPGKAEKIANFPKRYVLGVEARALIWNIDFDDETGAPTVDVGYPVRAYYIDEDENFIKYASDGKYGIDFHVYYSGISIGLNQAMSLKCFTELVNVFDEETANFDKTLTILAQAEQFGLSIINQEGDTFLAYLSDDEDAPNSIYVDIEIEMNVGAKLVGSVLSPIWEIKTVKVTKTVFYGIQ